MKKTVVVSQPVQPEIKEDGFGVDILKALAIYPDSFRYHFWGIYDGVRIRFLLWRMRRKERNA